MTDDTSRPKILALAGSVREASVNRRLLAAAAAEVRNAGGDVTLVELRDYPLPIYDGDLESASGLPEPALELQRAFRAHDGLLVAAPEYNGSITPLLKNTIDWLSRPGPDGPGLACFRGKVVGLLSASPGGLGGLRGLVHVRAILGNLGCLVLATQQALPGAGRAFDEDGGLLDEKVRDRVAGLAAELVTTTAKLRGG